MAATQGVRDGDDQNQERGIRMAIPTFVNGQITDSVTQSELSVLGSAPAVAMGSVYQTMAHSMSILYQNAVVQMYSAGTMAGAAAASKASRSDVTDVMLAVLVALAATR